VEDRSKLFWRKSQDTSRFLEKYGSNNTYKASLVGEDGGHIWTTVAEKDMENHLQSHEMLCDHEKAEDIRALRNIRYEHLQATSVYIAKPARIKKY